MGVRGGFLAGFASAMFFLISPSIAHAQAEPQDSPQCPSGCEVSSTVRLLGTFQLTQVGGHSVVSGTLHALGRDNAVEWFQVETGSEPAPAAPLEMIIRVETDGDASHRICHRRTSGADRGRLACVDGSEVRAHWDPSTGPSGSIQIFLPTQGGVLRPPESIAVILLAGPAAPPLRDQYSLQRGYSRRRHPLMHSTRPLRRSSLSE